LFLWGTSLVSRSSEFVPDRPAPYRLALTFDDGPHLYYTERLLAILREHGSAATFFVVGRKAEQYPGLVLAMGRDGHDVANHTFNHPNLTTLSARSIREELDRTQALLRKVSPASRPYFRPPGGRYNGKVARVAAENGYRMVLWNVFPQDHKRPSAQEIYDRVMAGAVDNGVVLLHSGIDSTLEALPRLIRDLKARGFQLVTVSQLLEQTPAQDQVAAWSPGAPAS
jgi:peptidoglycan-N-acetylglucosamine deacetylase